MAVVGVREPGAFVEEPPESARRQVVAVPGHLVLSQAVHEDGDDQLRRSRRGRGRSGGLAAGEREDEKNDPPHGGLFKSLGWLPSKDCRYFFLVYLIVRKATHFPSCSLDEVKTLWS
jgi:hypothetical protein